MMHCTRCIIEQNGTTGLQVGDRLLERVRSACGEWLPFWQVIAIETTRETPMNLPPGWSFMPLGLPLDQLYEQRDQFDIPAWMKDLPRDVWQDLTYGAGKLPVAAAIAFAMCASQLREKRRNAWGQLQDRQQLLLARWELPTEIELSNEAPLVILIGAAGGATGPAGVLNGVRFWQTHPDQPLILTFVLGPHCGSSSDAHRTERANAARLLASLAQIGQQTPRLWTFWIDGQPDHRERLIRETADLIFTLVARKEGIDLRRLLHDGFSKASRRYGYSICRFDFARLTLPGRLQQHVAEDELLEVIRGETQ